MRFQLFIWAVLFVIGALVGDRYELPGWARSVGERGFVVTESWFGELGEPIPDAGPDASEGEQPKLADASDADDVSPQPSAPASNTVGHATNATLRINEAGLDIIKESEGLRLEAYNYNGQWLIGYGHAATAKAGMTITEAQAEQLLRADVRNSEDAVRRMVTVPINENQFSAMVSLAYNLGSGGFSNTSVLERLNDGNTKGAADAFLRYNRARINGTLTAIQHLTKRRGQERTLFITPA